MPSSPNISSISAPVSFQLRLSRRRRTISLAVTDRGELVVYAPRGVSRKRLQRLVEENRTWIIKKQEERRQAWDRIQPGWVYYRGQAFLLQVISEASVPVRLLDGFCVVSPGPEGVWPGLLAWYLKEAEAFLAASLKALASRMHLTPPRMEVRDWRRRWGECRPGLNLRFNWRLILLPPEILDYVVAHELMHLRVPGHPSAFWQELGKYLPDYALRRRWLNYYGPPFLTWRLEEGTDSTSISRP